MTYKSIIKPLLLSGNYPLGTIAVRRCKIVLSARSPPLNAPPKILSQNQIDSFMIARESLSCLGHCQQLGPRLSALSFRLFIFPQFYCPHKTNVLFLCKLYFFVFRFVFKQQESVLLLEVTKRIV